VKVVVGPNKEQSATFDAARAQVDMIFDASLASFKEKQHSVTWRALPVTSTSLAGGWPCCYRSTNTLRRLPPRISPTSWGYV
jgi:hypothetical protein